MNHARLRYRSRVIRAVRAFFDSGGYLEVDTPLLSPHLIPEPSIEVFATRLLRPGGTEEERYLIPSPEVYMKALIRGGSGSIYQICRAFRNLESAGKWHSPEFTMLEWYTVDAGYLDSIAVCEAMFDEVFPPGTPAALRPPFARMTMAEAFREFAGFDLEESLDRESLAARGREHGVPVSSSDTWEQTFNRIFLQSVEPCLPPDVPLVLLDYPAGIPTLAARKEGTPWSERWELYVRGIEVANCFSEERDGGRVREYYESCRIEKGAAAVPHRIDPDYPKLFDGGFPRCSGVALGMDRLIALSAGLDGIGGVIFSPFSATV